MIRLVTQFDDPATAPSGATPSGASGGSCCCCCCSCVVTAVGASIISSRHVRSVRLAVTEPPPEGPPEWSEVAPVQTGWREVLAFFALWIGIAALLLATQLPGEPIELSLVLGVAAWGGALYLAYRGLGRPALSYIVLTIIATCGVGILEFFIWLALLVAAD